MDKEGGHEVSRGREPEEKTTLLLSWNKGQKSAKRYQKGRKNKRTENRN